MTPDRWDPGVFDLPAFLPFADLLAPLRQHARFPGLGELSALWLDGRRTPRGEPMGLIPHRPRTRRGRGPRSRDELYDLRVTGGQIPTRADNWHDLFNVLIFTAFPRSKEALHEQHRRILMDLIPPQIDRLPSGRTPEGDALTILDEGGAVLCAEGDTFAALTEATASPDPAPFAEAVAAGRLGVWLFGHAHLEQLALQATGAPITLRKARPVLLPLPPDAPRDHVDAALAAQIEALAPLMATPPPFAVPLTALIGG